MIYFIRQAETNYIKIGYTGGSVQKRLAQLQTASPTKLKLLMAIDGDVKIEREIHQILSGNRLYGEWFAIGYYGLYLAFSKYYYWEDWVMHDMSRNIILNDISLCKYIGEALSIANNFAPREDGYLQSECHFEIIFIESADHDQFDYLFNDFSDRREDNYFHLKKKDYIIIQVLNGYIFNNELNISILLWDDEFHYNNTHGASFDNIIDIIDYKKEYISNQGFYKINNDLLLQMIADNYSVFERVFDFHSFMIRKSNRYRANLTNDDEVPF